MIYSLVIPCFNESDGIPKLLDRCSQIKEANLEIIFVNNGSTDNSKEIFEELLPNYKNFRLVNLDKNIGYGDGILAGLNSAKGEILGWTHADLQTDPLDFVRAIELFKNKNVSFVKGKRFGRPFFDNIFTFGMSLFETFFLKRILYDINAQPTVFTRNFFESWENPPNDFSLDLYSYYFAKVKKIYIKRFPVYFGVREFGTSSWNINFPSKIKFIKRTIKYSFKLKKEIL